MKKIKAIRIILVIFSVLLALSFLMLMAVGISEMRDASRVYTVDSGYYVGDLRAKRYEQLLETAERDTAITRTNHPEAEAYRALAQYFRTTVQAVTYEKAGDMAAAEEMRALADSYAAKCPDYADYQADIREKVEAAILRGGAVYGSESSE